MKKWILMVSPNDYPNGDAGAVRDDAFASIYTSLGYNVVIICQNRYKKEGEYDGHRFISLYCEANGVWSKAFRFVEYKNKLINAIRDLEQENGIPDVIHLYDAPHNGIEFLKEYAKKNGVKLIHDSVEWYSAEEFKLGKLDKSYILKNRLNTKIIDCQFRVIAISRYLEKHFGMRGCRVVRVPVVMDVASMPICNDVYLNKKVRICYAGSPAKKDYLSKILKAVGTLDDASKEKMEINIIGVSKDQVKMNSLVDLDTLENIENCVNFFGRVPRSRVIEELKKSNFTILVRPKNSRYAMAGFPTKVAESMSIGVPVICNYSSDLGEYLYDGKNSIEIASESIDDIANAVKAASGLSPEEWSEMRQKARNTAELYFDYKKYADLISDLLK